MEAFMAQLGVVATTGLSAAVMLIGCTHTVKVEAPAEPITINLNVKIDQEVRVRLEEDIEDMIEANPDLF